MDSIVVPPDRLSQEALLGLVDAFVLREGTDYGHAEPSFEQKRAQVFAQIERDEVVIVFDPGTEEVTLVHARELPAAERPSSRRGAPPR